MSGDPGEGGTLQATSREVGVADTYNTNQVYNNTLLNGYVYIKPCGCLFIKILVFVQIFTESMQNQVAILCCVCLCVWGHLGVWRELASHKRLFNPPPQFSRLGT